MNSPHIGNQKAKTASSPEHGMVVVRKIQGIIYNLQQVTGDGLALGMISTFMVLDASQNTLEPKATYQRVWQALAHVK